MPRRKRLSQKSADPDHRSFALFIHILSPYHRRQWHRHGTLILKSQHGRLYRLSGDGVYELREQTPRTKKLLQSFGRAVHHEYDERDFCVFPVKEFETSSGFIRHQITKYDELATYYLALRFNERYFRRNANGGFKR